MEEEQNQKQITHNFNINMPTAIFLAIQFIFIIFLVISVPRMFQSDEISDWDFERIPVATIGNFTAVAPENYSGGIKSIEMTLFGLVLRNSPGWDVSKSVDAYIREDSIRTVYFEDENLNYFSAIVDLPEVEQSYWFYNLYSSDEGNQYIDYSKSYRIFCLDSLQEIIYSNFNCEDDFGLGGRLDLVSDLIGYFDFDRFGPSYSVERDVNEIKIYPYGLDNDDAKEMYIQQIKDAVASLGIAPDLFRYYVMNLKGSGS